MQTNQIRNIAIIAHVDHGKTTLVDHLLKQAHTFAAHQAEMQQETIMDSQELERERGVTILSKNIAIKWGGYKINIIDTPGHADFAGEVERILSMVDGCLLLVDAAEGVLSQTKYVLSLAIRHHLKIIVIINKIDKKDQRATEVLEEINDLFLDTAEKDEQLDFPVIYAIGKNGITGTQTTQNSNHSLKITDSQDLKPLFQTIINTIPAPKNLKGGFQLQVANIASDPHKGKYIIGKINRGQIKKGDALIVLRQGKQISQSRAEYIFTFQGLNKQEIDQTTTGDIVAIAGIKNPQIGDTVTSPDAPDALEELYIAEPTIQIEISASTSPLVGKDGKYTTSRQIKQRLEKELETNVSLKIQPGSSSENFLIAGRGEMHLSILIETMRREGYEFSVSRPQVIFKTINNQIHEPWELITIDIPEEYSGTIITTLGQRKTEMINMYSLKNNVRFEYKIATRNLIGLRSELLTLTSGMSVINSQFLGYEPKGEEAHTPRNGAIVASETGTTSAYSLEKVQQRATTFIKPGDAVYTGMIVGQNSRQEDIHMNVCKGKKLTNMRAASGDMMVKLAPPKHMSLEQYLTFLAPDELLEVTPKNLRLRKRNLTAKSVTKNK